MSTITETLFAPLAITTAPEASRPMLEKAKKSIGLIPNLLAIFANNTTVLEGYLAWAPCSRGLLHTNRTANHPAGSECREQVQLLRSRTFTDREEPPPCVC